jgi:hypothetical protein
MSAMGGKQILPEVEGGSINRFLTARVRRVADGRPTAEHRSIARKGESRRSCGKRSSRLHFRWPGALRDVRSGRYSNGDVVGLLLARRHRNFGLWATIRREEI